MAVEFHDFSVQVMNAMEDKAKQFLYEAAGEVEAQTKRNTKLGKVGGGQLKSSWRYIVDESRLTATVGSPLENAIWEEFGTGEFALKQNGRKGGWWIKVGNGPNEISPQVAKAYSWEKTRTDAEGNLTFVFTHGKKPHRALGSAFTTLKPALIRRARAIMRGLGDS